MPLTAACAQVSNEVKLTMPMYIGGLVEAEYVILYVEPSYR
jgi:hypothetical protein